MDFSPKKMVVGAILVVVALGLFLVLKPDSNNEETGAPQAAATLTGPTGTGTPVPEERKRPVPAPRPKVPLVEIKDGQPIGGIQELVAREGDSIRFAVKSDVFEEVHVHGFDESKPVGPGEPARFDFKAGFTGIFEVELENSAVPIMELQVNP